jgi:uncharacterized membrane protein
MKIIYYSLSLALIVFNIAGVTVLFRQWLPTYALARAAGILILGLIAFFIEHYFGFGQLNGFWVITTIVSALILYWRRIHVQSVQSRQFFSAELVFGLALLYGLSWRWYFPDIYPTSERVTDLYFIGNYLAGTKLPPLDHWFPPHRFDFYYSFQHYMAALMGRTFSLSPGLTYNLAFVILMALPITLAWDFTRCFLSQHWKRWLIIITFSLGGTGATVFVHIGHQHSDKTSATYSTSQASQQMWASQRFIGLYDQHLNTDIGQRLFPKPPTSQNRPLELPLEDFGYQFYVGDYHPPLGGFFLLLMGLTLIGVLETHRHVSSFNSEAISNSALKNTQPRFSQDALLQALLALTVPAMVATNTWTFPLQAMLIAGWMCWRLCNRQPPNWFALIIGGVAGFLLLYPFLLGFSNKIVSTPIRWVQTANHTPIRQFLALHWPLLLFTTLALFQKKQRRIGLCFGVTFLGLLMMSELIYVDDPSGDHYERTNTVMKWWGWIWSGGLIALATILLASKRRWLQSIVIVALLVFNIYVIDTAPYWWYTNKDNAGKLNATSVYTHDATVRDMFHYLEQAPYGIVLENSYGDAYTDSAIYAAFATKPTVLGWPSHVSTWRGGISRIWHLKDEINNFYAGTMTTPEKWLLANKVDYIVWNKKDASQPDAWTTISNAIIDDYYWVSFQPRHLTPIGFWVRR